MAEAISKEGDSFTCPVCLDILKDPVTIPCGHNFCMRCIKCCWDQEDGKGNYTCPLCKLTFTPRPVLYKNPLIAEMVKKFELKNIKDVSPAPSYASPGDVHCDVCIGRKLKATKSCLTCLLSYCKTHIQRHDELFVGKSHNVVGATSQIQEKICTEHGKPFEVFCRTDQKCICYQCLMENHNGHNTVSAEAERTARQGLLVGTQKNFQQRIQEIKKKMQEVKKAVETFKSSAQVAQEDSERIFTEMIRSIEKRRSEVKQLIRAQEKAEVSQAEGHLKRLEQEIAELKRRGAELEHLSQTEDHIYVLKNFHSVTTPPRCKDLSSMTVNQSLSLEAVKKSVSTLKEQVEDFCTKEIKKISVAVSDVHAVIVEPVTREELLKYACHFTLDSNTAHGLLHLSKGNRRVERRAEAQSYPDHPERFDRCSQVLCREGVSGRCYWEVEWNGDVVYIAVSYKNISRKGDGKECWFGRNDQSWRLGLCSTSSSFWYNNKETKLPLVASSRIGVYVDHRAGTLAFYSVSDTVTLLHRVQTTFTQAIYPGFYVCYKSSLEISSSLKTAC